MTARALRMAAATSKQANISPYAKEPSLVPANFGVARFVWEINASGYGYPGLSSAAQAGLSVWDWNSTLNRYELSNFVTSANWVADFSSGATGIACMVNATQVLVIANGKVESTSDTKVGRSLTTIGSFPSASITLTTAAAYAYDEPSVAVTPYSNPVGYAGNLLVAFATDGTSSTWPTSNGFVEKVAVAAASRNATALASGLPSSNAQARVGVGMAGLGGAAPNGYAVVDVSFGSTCAYRLVNCTATPVAVGTQVSFTGTPAGARAIVPVGAASAVAFDFGTALGTGAPGRASLLTANSATAPTTLTKGVETNLPNPIDFPVGDLYDSYVNTEPNASNNWIREGATMVWVTWERKAAAGGGAYSRLMYVTSSGPSNLAMSLPAVDIEGKPSPVRTSQPSYNCPIISAPGGKVVVMVPAANGQYQQYVYQL